MNCGEARHIILSGDPQSLRDRTDPVLRAHLEACPNCAQATAYVVSDLGRLKLALAARATRAVPVRTPRPAKSFAMSLVPVALAAELALFAFLGHGNTANTLLDRNVVIDDSVTSMLPAAHVDVDTGEVRTGANPTVVIRKADSASRRDSLAQKLAAAVQSLRAMSIAPYHMAPHQGVTALWQTTRGDTL